MCRHLMHIAGDSTHAGAHEADLGINVSYSGESLQEQCT